MRLSLTSKQQFALRALATALLLTMSVVAGAIFAPDAAAQDGGSSDLTGTIVFQTVSGGSIYAINADGSNLRYLATGMDPALSPDGQWVAFTRWDDTQHGATGSLWVINVDGSGERVIVGDVHQPKAPVWSPNGTQIAISMQHGGRLAPESKCDRSLPSEPLVADEDGDYFRVVVEIDEDGDYFRVVVEIDEDGEVETRLCYTLLPHPFWSLRVVDVATGAFEDLPSDLFSYAPTWDPANDWRLVYDGELGLVNLDLTRSEGSTWALTDDVRDHAPVFSPDGSKIAVSYWQHDHWEIHVLNADGSGRVRLTRTPLRVIVEQGINDQAGRAWNNAAPVWSPDGNKIAFLTDRSGQWEIWVMDADGKNQHPIFPPETLHEWGLYSEITLQYYSVGERVLSWR